MIVEQEGNIKRAVRGGEGASEAQHTEKLNSHSDQRCSLKQQVSSCLLLLLLVVLLVCTDGILWRSEWLLSATKTDSELVFRGVKPEDVQNNLKHNFSTKAHFRSCFRYTLCVNFFL